MSAAGERAGSGEPLWTVAAVARRLGVSPSTLRSWSLRHGIGPAGHEPGRYRRYTDTDVAELDTMRGLVEQGMTLSAAAAVARRGRDDRSSGRDAHPGPGTTAPGHQGTNLEPARAADAARALAAAAQRLDLDAAVALVTATLTEHGVAVTWNQVCRPALVELDRHVARDGSCLDAALLLSWAIGTALRHRSIPLPDPGTAPVLLAATAGEQHTLALEALHAALTEHGVPARMLGPAVPTTALHTAAHTLHPAAVVVWAQTVDTAEPGALPALVPGAAIVVAAGPGWTPTTLPPAVTHANSLDAAVNLTVRPPSPLP